MDEQLSRRAHVLLMQAVELDERERPAFLRSACADDPRLRERVGQLLAALERSSTFLATPALGERQPAEGRLQTQFDAVGDYRIVRVIGAGGMATVYEAIQSQPRRRVALKMMRHGLAQTSAVQRFRFETEVLARLQHPGIAQIYEAGAYDCGPEGPLPFFVMEYIAEASTITAFAKQRALSLRERLRMLADVCDAVQHGHQLGVIHRDLKPGNILVDQHGRPKVIDFGVARSSDGQAGITRHSELGQLIGTLNYMSPEQCRGEGRLDIRTDVYSLGVILYELLSDRLPHDVSGLPLPEALRQILSAAPPPLGSVQPAVRGDIECIVHMAIDKEPDRRYPTVAALAADIRRFLRNESIEARPPTMMYRCRLFVRRHRLLVGAFTAVTAVVIVGVGLVARFAYQTMQESRRRIVAEAHAIQQRDEARWHSYIASIASAFAALGAGEFQQLRTRLALAPEEHRGWEWRFLSGMADRSAQTIAAHDDMVYAFFAGSPGGTRLATGARDGSLRVWSVSDGQAIAHMTGTPGAPIMAAEFSPDGQRVVAGSEDGTVDLWDGSTGGLLCRIGRHEAPVRSVSHSPRAEIASASDDGHARIWNAQSGALLNELDDQPGGIHGVAFSADGATLLTWNRGGAVWLRDAATLAVYVRMDFEEDIGVAVLSRDGSYVAAGGPGGRVVIWTAHDGEVLQHLDTSPSVSSVRSLAFSSDSGRLAAGQTDRTITIWSVADGQRLDVLRGHEEAVSGVWFNPAGDKLVSASWDRTLRLWEVDGGASLSPISTLHGHAEEVLAATFSPDGGLLASAGMDETVRLWDPALGMPLGVLRGHRQTVYAVAFSPDGAHIASASHDRSIRLWNRATGAPLGELRGHRSAVWSVAFSPDGTRLASAGDDSTIRIWDVEARTELRTLTGHERRVIQIAFTPDGKQLASASRDATVRLWDVESGLCTGTLLGHELDVFAVTFSHDGRRLYSGSRDQTARVWDVATGQCLKVLGGHGQFITCLAISAGGSRLAAGSWFGKILLWDLATHDLVASFEGHDNAIRSITFSPDDRWLVTGSYDHNVRCFDVASPAQRRALRDAARSNLESARALLDHDPETSADALDGPLGGSLRKLLLLRALDATESRQIESH